MSRPVPTRLLEAAHSAPSADNSQPWRFVWDGTHLELLFGGDAREEALFGPASPATLLTIGGVVENLFAAAQLLGYDLSREAAELPDYSAGRYLRVAVKGTPKPDGADIRPILSRHTNRFAYRSDALPPSAREAITGLNEPPARLLYFDDAGDRSTLAAMVSAASRIRFRTRELHEWLAESLRHTPEQVAHGDGLDVRTLDLPPGGGIFLRLIGSWRRMQTLNRIGAFRAMAAIESQPIRRGPVLLALVAPADATGCIAAGRLMTRVWTRLNAEGIAVHPYYGIPDQLQRLRDGSVPKEMVPEAERLRDRCREFLGIDREETLHMLLRVGRPGRDPIRSRRRPLPEVLIDRSDATTR